MDRDEVNCCAKALKRKRPLPIDTDAQHGYDQIEQTHETLMGDIMRILIENPLVSGRTTALLEFQLSSLGMKGCDNPCHTNQPRVRHASVNPTQISANTLASSRQFLQNFYKSWNAASYTRNVCLPVCGIGNHQQERRNGTASGMQL